ncbi:YdcH family protein [Atopomonas sediminilitoris]|uniref:YdcH family protein n=1 Tax=Atopomonas sediminilitoris TaxID=2919919 RepID=UPI001F4D5E4B|nr:YdcH family protein [Atopomonas sediminilitoris]MCJ8170604.1 YdcH family protein [Atopomonas sediminilitoris]
MHVEHHPLINDFPELRAELQALRANDQHFARLAGEYEALDKQICRIEDGVELLDDAALTELKTERVQRKDELAGLLRKATKPTCCGSCGG